MDWNLAMKVFISGITGVFIVMIVLQLSVTFTAWVVKMIESANTSEEKKSQASS
ncbi:MAG: oxaloacetate decarboxylase subunit gamma [Thermoanaerobacteraceae bacterium]|nr:oxaloacetate decarboxylase subunit gamma [Thermoanaerobacteraceae bacterium]